MNIKARLHSIKPKFLVCSEDHPRTLVSASAVRTTAQPFAARTIEKRLRWTSWGHRRARTMV